jgi:hypothetical protein
MSITREDVVKAIALERKVLSVLQGQSTAGIYASIDNADQGFDATTARYAALQEILDQIDRNKGMEEV